MCNCLSVCRAAIVISCHCSTVGRKTMTEPSTTPTWLATSSTRFSYCPFIHSFSQS